MDERLGLRLKVLKHWEATERVGFLAVKFPCTVHVYYDAGVPFDCVA